MVAMPAPHTGRRRTSSHSSGNENAGLASSASVALRSSTNAAALAAAASRTSTITSINDLPDMIRRRSAARLVPSLARWGEPPGGTARSSACPVRLRPGCGQVRVRVARLAALSAPALVPTITEGR